MKLLYWRRGCLAVELQLPVLGLRHRLEEPGWYFGRGLMTGDLRYRGWNLYGVRHT